MVWLMCSVFGQLLSVDWEVQAQAVTDRELVSRLDCIIGVHSSSCRMLLICGYWVAPEGNVFLLEGRHSAT